MIDTEVERLRRLRDRALRVRAIARTAGRRHWVSNDPLLSRGGCAAWRIARLVTGRLRAHPHARFQKDAGIATLVMNSAAAHLGTLTNRTRRQTLSAFARELKNLSREVDDARALTWLMDLSDAFGRSQRELHGLAAALATDAGGIAEGSARGTPVLSNAAGRQGQVGAAAARAVAAGSGDWPYLAF